MIKLEEPDKGQAWVVAIAACIINMILSGLSRMIGLLYVAVIDAYSVSRQDATLPFTVRNAIRCLSGPLVGIIGQRYGIRAVTFVGGVVASAGAALCCIAPNIAWLAVFWGGMHGLGFAFANTLFQVIVNQYFQKYRATASGIALSGACVGSLVFPFMIEEILDIFGISGGFLILGGIVMHVLPPSLLLKSPPWIVDPVKYARLKALLAKQAPAEIPITDEMPETPPPEVDSNHELRDITRSTSLSNCPIENLDVCTRSLSRGSSAENLTNLFEHHQACATKCKKNVVCTLYQISESPPLYRRNSSRHGSEVSVDNGKASEIPTICGDLASKEKESKDPLPVEEEKNLAAPPTSLWENFLAISFLYTNPAYMLISLCMTTYVIIFIPLLTVVVDYSKDKGIPESLGKYLINAMAAGDLIGRLCFGWLTDRNIITIPVFMTLAFVLQGVWIALFPFALSFYPFMALLVLYGVMAGTVLVHFPLLVLKYVDHSHQSIAMGCVGFMSGIVSLGIPYLIGHFRDTVGSYDGMFYLTGGISVVSGGLWLLEPAMLRIHNKNTDKKAIKKKMAEEQLFENGKDIVTVACANEQKSS